MSDREFSLGSSCLNSALNSTVREKKKKKELVGEFKTQEGLKHSSHLKIWHAERKNHTYLEVSTSFITLFSSLLSFSRLLL